MKLNFPKHYHKPIYFIGLSLMAIGLPLSIFLMSLSQFILLGNWLVEGQLKKKVNLFLSNKSALVISSLILLHLIGLLYSSDFNYAFKDIRMKIPLLLLPLIMSTTPSISKKQFQGLVFLFVTCVFIATLISMTVLWGMTGYQIVDIRQISIFISHIRFSLLICLAIFMLIYFIRNPAIPSLHPLKWFLINGSLLLLVFWFIAFLIILESITGLIILMATSLVLLFYFVFAPNKRIYKLLSIFLIILFVSSIVYFTNQKINEYYQRNTIAIEKLELSTPSGNKYFHDVNDKQKENGNFIWQYLCWKELKEQWRKKSSINFEDLDLKGNQIKYTLLRYLTSKGMRKDSTGIANLKQQDIRNIENGIANINYGGTSNFNGRINKIIWEFDEYFEGANPSGHSVTQRLEFWKTAMGIISENPFIGVGTGDVATAFEKQYEKTNSPLDKLYRLRAHNQFLAITVAFGFIGLFWFLVALIYPLWKEKKIGDYFYLVFLIIAILSMLTEDTLETQAGISFFAFFNALFLFAYKDKKIVD